MYHHRSIFEFYLEILTQVKGGICSCEDLARCMRLSRRDLIDALAPLVSEGLIKKDKLENPLIADEVYRITSKGEQFIELMEIAFQYVDVENSD